MYDAVIVKKMLMQLRHIISLSPISKRFYNIQHTLYYVQTCAVEHFEKSSFINTKINSAEITRNMKHIGTKF